MRIRTWFAEGDISLDQLRKFTVQFSVFSNQFLLAALNRVINADTLFAAHEAKEILMNELGVIYNKGGGSRHSDRRPTPTRTVKAIPRWCPRKERWTAASSVSRQRIWSGCCGSASPSV